MTFWKTSNKTAAAVASKSQNPSKGDSWSGCRRFFRYYPWRPVWRQGVHSAEHSHENRISNQKVNFVGVLPTPLPLLLRKVWTSRNIPPTPVQSNSWFRGHFQVGKKGRYACRKHRIFVEEIAYPFSWTVTLPSGIQEARWYRSQGDRTRSQGYPMKSPLRFWASG